MWSTSPAASGNNPTPVWGDDDCKSATDRDSAEIINLTRTINELKDSLMGLRYEKEEKVSELESCKADRDYYKLQAQAFKEHAKNLEKIIEASEKKNMEN